MARSHRFPRLLLIVLIGAMFATVWWGGLAWPALFLLIPLQALLWLAARYSVSDLRASKQTYVDLLNAAHEAIFVHDAETGQVLHVNDRMLEMFRCSRDDVLSGRFAFMSGEEPYTMDRALELIQRARTEGPQLTDSRARRSDGELFWVEVALREAVIAGVPRVIAAVWDTTERIEAAEALETSDERYRLVFNQQFQFMAILSPDGRVIDINELPLHMTGAPREEYVGKLFWETPGWAQLDGWPERIRERVEQVVASPAPLLVEDVYATATGETRSALAAYSAIRGNDGNVRYISVQAIDITERKRAERQLELQMKQQRLLVSELDHRVRNNLAALLSLIHLSREQATTVDQFADSVTSRTMAIASVHAALSDAQWRGGDTERMIRAIVRPVHATELNISGPRVTIPLAQAQAFGLILNEMATNSLKHGAMSTTGRLDIGWTLTSDENGVQHLELRWRESGGPKIVRSPTPGTGSRIIEGLAASELRGRAELRFPRDGVDHLIVATFLEEATAQFEPAGAYESSVSSTGI